MNQQPNQDMREQLLRALEAPEVHVRSRAVIKLAALKDPVDTPLLIRALDDFSSSVRSNAMFALRYRVSPDMCELLHRALEDSEGYIRGQAIAMLAELNDPAIDRKYLIRAMDDPSSTVRGEALNLLAMQQDLADTPLLIQAMDDPSSSVRNSAIFRLGLRLNPDMRELLNRALTDSSNYVRRQAAIFLNELDELINPPPSKPIASTRSFTPDLIFGGPHYVFRSDNPLGGANSYDWTYGDQERFETIWTAEGDQVADELAEHYAFGWPWLIAQTLASSAPVTVKAIMKFATSDDRPSHPYRDRPDVMFDHIAMWGSFHAVRKRRTWAKPNEAICPTCGGSFWTGHLSHWAFKRFGPARYCPSCCARVLSDGGDCTREGAIAAVRNLYEAFGVIPNQSFSFPVFPPDASDQDRDRWMRALVSMPGVEGIKQALSQQDWFGVLQEVGLVGTVWRPSLGTWCRAADGHLCRSLLEKSIDDWLSRHGIVHECEPYWPKHPTLNPSGLKRADWVLSDGSYVECAGLLERKDYVKKIVEKRELAEISKINLIVITPADLFRLDAILGSVTQAKH